jgi:hypothetical protein
VISPGWRRPAQRRASRERERGAERATLPTNLFLIGSPYCGSTYLGGLIESNFDAVYAGEFARLPRFVHQYGLSDRPTGCLLCQAADRPCPAWTPAILAEAEAAGPAGSLEVLRRHSGANLIVDGSKWPEWLRVVSSTRTAASAQVAAVILVRSPLRYAVSAMTATGAPTWQVAQWWRDVYADALRTVARLMVPTVIIRNEDLRRDPLSTVAAVASLVHRDPPEVLIAYKPTHSIGGNLWVQNGYSPATQDLEKKLGLRDGDRDDFGDEVWAAVLGQSSTTEAHRPRTRDDSLAFAQTVFDCPGLVNVAQSLGYEVVSDIELFVREASDRAAA